MTRKIEKKKVSPKKIKAPERPKSNKGMKTVEDTARMLGMTISGVFSAARRGSLKAQTLHVPGVRGNVRGFKMFFTASIEKFRKEREKAGRNKK